MQDKEIFSTIRVPRKLRLQLKRIAADREQSMYEVLEDVLSEALAHEEARPRGVMTAQEPVHATKSR